MGWLWSFHPIIVLGYTLLNYSTIKHFSKMNVNSNNELLVSHLKRDNIVFIKHIKISFLVTNFNSTFKNY